MSGRNVRLLGEVRTVLLEVAAELRAAAAIMGVSHGLQRADRNGLRLVADLVERRARSDFVLPRAVGGAIDRLIDVLDTLDGDPDLEDGHDAEADGADLEPSLGATDGMDQAVTWSGTTLAVDLEMDGEAWPFTGKKYRSGYNRLEGPATTP